MDCSWRTTRRLGYKLEKAGPDFTAVGVCRWSGQALNESVDVVEPILLQVASCGHLKMLCLPDELLLFTIQEIDALCTRRQLRLVCRRLWRLCNTAGFRISAKEIDIGRGGLVSDEAEAVNRIKKLVSTQEFVETRALSVTSRGWVEFKSGNRFLETGSESPERLNKWKRVRANGRTALQRAVDATRTLEYLRIDAADQWMPRDNEYVTTIFSVPLSVAATSSIVVLEIGRLRVNTAFFEVNRFPSLQVLCFYTASPLELERKRYHSVEYSISDLLMLVNALAAYDSPLHTLVISVKGDGGGELSALIICVTTLKHLRHLSFVAEALVDRRDWSESNLLCSSFFQAPRSKHLETLAIRACPPFAPISTPNIATQPTGTQPAEQTSPATDVKRKRLGARPGQSVNKGVYERDLVEGCALFRTAFPALRTVGWLVPQAHYSESYRLWCERGPGEDGEWVYAGNTADCWPTPDYAALFPVPVETGKDKAKATRRRVKPTARG